MSELSKLTAAGRSDVIPGYVLSPFRLTMYAEAEEEFSRAHIATAAGATAGLPDAIQEKIVKAAVSHVRDNSFAYGTNGFDRKALSQATTPFLLWLSLRVKHPKLTRLESAALITEANEANVYNVVRQLMGYNFDSDTSPNASGTGAGGPSNGETSTPPSEPAGSPPDKSPT